MLAIGNGGRVDCTLTILHMLIRFGPFEYSL